MTHDLYEYYGVTLYPNTKEKIGYSRYRAKAVIFRRDNGEIIETFFAEGFVISTIYQNAIDQTKRKTWCKIPDNWKQ